MKKHFENKIKYSSQKYYFLFSKNAYIEFLFLDKKKLLSFEAFLHILKLDFFFNFVFTKQDWNYRFEKKMYIPTKRYEMTENISHIAFEGILL